MTLHTETINDLIERQLDRWPEARQNFFRLGEARRKPLAMGALKGAAQLNPARIRSTAVATDPRSVAERPCFLCSGNRPPEQTTTEDFLPGWHLLVNPFPILPVHFTIASASHTPQNEIPLEMAAMAEQAPSLAFFFNGAKAGASAPDHLHVQAVLAEELPLLRLVAERHPASCGGFLPSTGFGLELPFHFVSAVVTPDLQGMLTLSKIPEICGLDTYGNPDKGLVNAFFWIGNEGYLRAVVVPRKAHRPACYYAEDDSRMLVSPGAIDMAGLVILPHEHDFDRITSDMMRQIYSETAYADSLPERIISILQ